MLATVKRWGGVNTDHDMRRLALANLLSGAMFAAALFCPGVVAAGRFESSRGGGESRERGGVLRRDSPDAHRGGRFLGECRRRHKRLVCVTVFVVIGEQE
jgi:hypothetical protein